METKLLENTADNFFPLSLRINYYIFKCEDASLSLLN